MNFNRKMIRKLLALSISTAMVTGVAFAQDDAPAQDPASVEASEFQANLMASLAAQPELGRFHQLIVDAGLEARLNDGESYTIFVPSNEVLDELQGTYDIDALGEFELQTLANALIVSGSITPDALATAATVDTIGGTSYQVAASGEAIEVDGVSVSVAEAIVTDNGVIYVLSEPFPQFEELLAGLPLNPAESLETEQEGTDTE